MEKKTSYLCFTLKESNYCISSYYIDEIVSDLKITRLPQVMGYVAGVINLRGEIVPILDLGYKLGYGKNSKKGNLVVIVVRVSLDNLQEIFGILVDSAHEVIDADINQVKTIPVSDELLNSEYISGILEQNDKNIIIMNIEKVIKDTEFIL